MVGLILLEIVLSLVAYCLNLKQAYNENTNGIIDSSLDWTIYMINIFKTHVLNSAIGIWWFISLFLLGFKYYKRWPRL